MGRPKKEAIKYGIITAVVFIIIGAITRYFDSDFDVWVYILIGAVAVIAVSVSIFNSVSMNELHRERMIRLVNMILSERKEDKNGKN